MRKLKTALILTFIVVILGCNHNNNISEFTYKFSMESTGNFKVEFLINPDSSFTINQTNLFFDKFDGTYRPVNVNGKLTEVEFNKLRDLIEESRIDKMNDSYGFTDNDNGDKTVIYNIELKDDKIHKFVTINLNTEQQFSNKFIELIEYTNSILDNKIKNRSEI